MKCVVLRILIICIFLPNVGNTSLFYVNHLKEISLLTAEGAIDKLGIQLPKKIIKNLELRKCLLPVWLHRNIIPYSPIAFGEYAKVGQIDTAVLCLKQTDNNKITGEIVIYWGGMSRCENKIEPFGLAIQTERIVKKNLMTKNLPPYLSNANFLNDGLLDQRIESSQNLYYCHNKTWHLLQTGG